MPLNEEKSGDSTVLSQRINTATQCNYQRQTSSRNGRTFALSALTLDYENKLADFFANFSRFFFLCQTYLRSPAKKMTSSSFLFLFTSPRAQYLLLEYS